MVTFSEDEQKRWCLGPWIIQKHNEGMMQDRREHEANKQVIKEKTKKYRAYKWIISPPDLKAK